MQTATGTFPTICPPCPSSHQSSKSNNCRSSWIVNSKEKVGVGRVLMHIASLRNVPCQMLCIDAAVCWAGSKFLNSILKLSYIVAVTQATVHGSFPNTTDLADRLYFLIKNWINIKYQRPGAVGDTMTRIPCSQPAFYPHLTSRLSITPKASPTTAHGVAAPRCSTAGSPKKSSL